MQTQRSPSLATSLLVHDLRAPAATAKAALELMLIHDSNRQCVLELALIIKRNLELMEFRLNSILDIAKTPTQANLILHPHPCDIGTIAREVRRDIELVYGPRLKLQASYGIKGFWDGDCIRRILENIIVNGFRHGRQDGFVTLALRQEASFTTISVHNEGTPMETAQNSGLFEPFSRGMVTQQNDAKGWGLGLAFVREAVEAHRGRIAVKSTLKEGTTFIMTLPSDTRIEAIHVKKGAPVKAPPELGETYSFSPNKQIPGHGQ